MNFTRFENIKDDRLRIYNRVVMASNLLTDFGLSTTKDYVSTFSNEEHSEMLAMQAEILRDGMEAVRASISRTMEPEGWDDAIEA